MAENEPVPEEPETADAQEAPTAPPSFAAPPTPKSKKRFLLIPLVVIVIAALAFAGWKFFGSKKPADKPATSSAPSLQTEPAEETNKDIPDAAETKEYESGFLGVKLTHPTTWTATEAEDTNSVRLESPTFAYQTLKGQVTGNFRIYIRKTAREVDGKYIGRGYAIAPSEKLTYTKPALGQRAETSLTLFGLDTPDNFAFFMIAGNYNLKKGDTLGPDYGKEAETYIIAGGYSSKELKDDLATHPVAIEMPKTSNAYKQAIDILKSLQLR